MNFRLPLLSLILLFNFHLLAQTENFNLELLMQRDYPENCNDIWGYVDENGDEYAILGTVEATAIIALDGPNAPREIAYIPGTRSTWRDMKHFQDRVYVTTDVGEDGLLIIDMSQASSDSIDFFYWTPELSLGNRELGTLDKCHNLYVDASTGYLYLSGCNNLNDGGMLIFDLNNNPDEPVLVGASQSVYSHDVYANGNLMFGNDIYNGELSIHDITDKTSPQLVALQPTTGAFTHNAWSSTNNDYVFTTDEIEGGFLDAYDIRDLDNIQLLDSWRPQNANEEGIIPHNTHYYDGFLHTSWYTVGIVVLDATDPTNLVPAAWYDTYDGDQRRFNGAWGAYPFLPSGRLLVSDINSGLYVFDTDIQAVARLEGEVTDIITGTAIQNVDIRIEDFINTTEVTAADGSYKTGTAKFDSVIIHFEKENYLPYTDTLDLNAGETLKYDVELVPDFQLFSWNLNVRDSAQNFPLEAAQARLFDIDLEESFLYQTTANGQLEQPLIPEGQYELYYGKWGWKENWIPNFNVEMNRSDSLFLAKGYRDYFNLDFGWSTEASSATGKWERVIPAGTQVDTFIFNPNTSSPNDFGRRAFVTGNNNQSVGFDDVDDGDVTLRSPWMDVSDWSDIQLSFDYWFVNESGANTPNDSLRVSIVSPDQRLSLLTITESSPEWKTFSLPLDSVNLSRKDSIQIEFVASDYPQGGGHIVEAGIDAFEVSGKQVISSTGIRHLRELTVYPNPTSHKLFLNVEKLEMNPTADRTIMIYHTTGQRVHFSKQIDNEIDVSRLGVGTYILLLKEGDNLWSTKFQLVR